MKERDVVRQILGYLAAKHVFAGQIGTGNFFGEHQGKRWAFHSHTFGPGCADILAFPDPPGEGRILWIECKSPGGVQSALQKSFEAEVKSRGHEYVVAYSSDDVADVI